MSDRELIAQIRGVVDASVKQAFAEVANGSAKMGSAVEASNKKAAAATRDFEKAQKDSQARMAALGSAIGTTVGFLSTATNAFEVSAAIQRQLEQAIRNTGASYEQYADQIKAAGQRAVQLGIDDEKAAQAIQALTESTGSAQVALDQLALVQDIAAAKGMDLVTAAELVGKVMNGNVGILARYGISVEKGATSTEALAQIQAQVAGQAEAQASKLDVWRVQLDNIVEKIGGATGAFAPFIGMLPGLSMGVSAAGGVIGAFTDVLKNSATASAALSVAMGPVGIAAAALIAAGGVALLINDLEDYAFMAKAAAAVTTDLENFYSSMAGVMGEETSKALKDVKDGFEEISSIGLNNEGLVTELQVIKTEFGSLDDLLGYSADALRNLTDEEKAFLDVNKDGFLSLVEIQGALERFSNSLRLTDDQARGVSESIQSIFSHPNIDGGKVAAEFDQINKLFTTGAIDGAQYESQIASLAAEWYKLAESADRGARGIQSVTDAQKLLAASTPQAIEDQKQLVVVGDRYTAMAEEGVFVDGKLVGSKKTVADAAAKAAKATEDETIAQEKLNRKRAERVVELPELESKINAKKVVDLTDEFWAMSVAGETAMDKIARGSTSAAVALAAFKEVQDGIISDQEPFNAQLSEYTTQLGYLQNAEDLLNQRRSEGIALTKEQETFLNQVDAAQGRLTGGTEDATIALGMQALQYAENMRIGDAMNEKLGQNASSSDALRSSIDALTTALGGIPPDTTANVYLNDEVTPNLGGILSALSRLDGYTVNTYVQTTSYTSPMDINRTYRDGGVVEPQWPTLHARDGLATPGGARFVRMNEAGGEDVLVPGGSYIRNAAASAEARGRSRGRGETINVNTLILHPASPGVYNAIRSTIMGGRN